MDFTISFDNEVILELQKQIRAFIYLKQTNFFLKTVYFSENTILMFTVEMVYKLKLFL